MHSFHRSRGRIFFEVSCALAIAVCLANAWKQTGASALLAAAAVAGLFGIINAFDMLQRRPADAEEPQRIDFETVEQGDLPVAVEAAVEATVVELPLTTDQEEAEPVAVALPQAIRNGQAKARRKGGGRKPSAREEATVTEIAPVEAVEAAVEVPEVEEAEVPELAAADEPDVEMPVDGEFAFPADDEPAQPHIAPLFEPEPFARMPRRAFGRRGRL